MTQSRHMVHVSSTCFPKLGPEPATDMVFSNVTESSLAVSWSKPKAIFTGFRVTYTNIVTGLSKDGSHLHSARVDLLLTLFCCCIYNVMCHSTRGETLCQCGLSAVSCGSVILICWILLHYFCHVNSWQSPE